MLLQPYHERVTVTVQKFMSRQEAAAALGMDVPAVDRLISNGLLDRYRIRGQYVRVPTGQVAELATLPRDWLLRC